MALSGYGRLYVAAGVTAQALDATPGTFDKMTGFATSGISLNATNSVASSNITLTQAGGTGMPIHAHVAVSFTVGTAGLYRVAIYQDGVVIPGSERRLTCALSTTYTVTSHALTTATDGNAPVFDVRVASDQTSPNFTPSYSSFEVWH